MKYIIPSGLMDALPKNKTYSKFEACFDILTMADEYGRLDFTIRELMRRWGWGNAKVQSFIKQLREWNVILSTKTVHETVQKQYAKYRINTCFLALDQYKNSTRNSTKTVHEMSTKNHETFFEDEELFKRIIERLNEKCSTSYTFKNGNTAELIQSRINEGFSEDDFYVVIDKKAKEWMGTEYERFLRPQTLFGDKFESYLNQNIKIRRKTGFSNFEERDYDFDDMENQLLNSQ